MMSEMVRRLDFDKAPLIVIWEITRACALACKHCRAEAMTKPDPRQLSFADGCRVMDQVKEMGAPVFVLTGGDPLARPDFYDLIAYGTKIGLRVSSSPSGTNLVTREAMERAAAAGLKRVQFSLDGATAETHDQFRGVKGSFQLTMDGMRYAREAGMELQIGTTVSRYSLAELTETAAIAERMGATLWSLFFLVPVGRGQAADMISPEESEQVMAWLYDLSGRVPFAIKTTEAPFFRRVAQQRGGAHGTSVHAEPALPAAGARPAPGMAMPGRIASFGVNDGKGFLFVDHLGEVYPSGFLPISAGNIHTSTLATLYQDSPLFQELRNTELLKGKCGACEYRRTCGGSRSRAYAMTGDYMESDPACAYVPPKWQRQMQAEA